MRLGMIAIVILGCANLIMAPLGMTHAHFVHTDHTVTHSGHFHADPDHGHDQEDGALIDLSADAKVSAAKAEWSQFVAVLFLLGLAWILVPVTIRISTQRNRQTEPIRRPCRPPPMRGPPLYSC
jgi:hypothetical protein